MAQEITLRSNIRIYRWIILLVTTVAQASVSFVSQGIGPLAPFLESGLKLNKTQVGFVGGAVNLGMTCTSLLVGKAVDLLGEKVVLVVGGLLTGCSIFLASYVKSFPVLIVLLIITGLWCASATPAGSKAIMTWFPYTRRGAAMGIRQTGAAMGGLVAALLLPYITSNHDWRLAMAGMGAIPIFGSIICFLLYKDYPEKLPRSDVTPIKNDWTVLGNTSIWLASFTGMTLNVAQFCILTYLVLYVHDRTGISIVNASIFLVIAQLGGILGRIFWGIISDTICHGARKPVLVGVGFLAVSTSLSMLFVTKNFPVWAVGLVSLVFGFSAIGWNGLYVALISELSGKDNAGTALGFGLTLAQLGAVIFPPIFGYIVDFSGSFKTSWIVLAGFIFIGIIVLGFVKEPISESL
jgi:sugar phosphate permease